jgi:hypothetical protein
MEFRKFLDEVMLLPCQIVRAGGQLKGKGVRTLFTKSSQFCRPGG